MRPGGFCRAFAPATIGNLAAGFDVLGVSLAPVDSTLWGDIVTIRVPRTPRRADRFTVTGPHANAVPSRTTENLVMIARRLFNQELRRRQLPTTGLELCLEKCLPVCSGLGSSASSVVAALMALNTIHESPLPTPTLLELAGRAEGHVSGSIHLDNVAPSMLGGIQLLVPGTNNVLQPVPLPWFSHWYLTVVHPDLQVPTALARQVLPPAFSRAAAVDYWSNLAGLVHALHTGNESLAARCLRDPLIEPHRQSLVKGFDRVKREALAAGALGFSLSGSGPSVFAVTESLSRAEELLDRMQQAFQRARVTSQGHVCRPDNHGARIIESDYS
ncbi:MAG TPA: homoserine kinase [Candidatus Ozemobacteraceae bacterium]|nr:homoserine kinase [Candidatus Ozemobacteraceae bacterium]